jgi:hypothetical protein
MLSWDALFEATVNKDLCFVKLKNRLHASIKEFRRWPHLSG